MLKNIHIWLGGCVRPAIRNRFVSSAYPKTKHILFCFVDHFEPDWGGADRQNQDARVKRWLEDYPKLAGKHKDADGCCPKHTFFYPAEVYVKEHLDQLAQLCKGGAGEVEIHLHHDNDNEHSLREKLERAKRDFAGHGLLGEDKKTAEIRYGFIHGNWALNNSRKDGRWCGVNNETTILRETGCYADFTLPSAPSETQTSKIDSIYYDTRNSAQKPKSHDTGEDAAVGKTNQKGLMIVQGPLALNWKRRKYKILPRIENGDISAGNLPTSDRVDLWIKQEIRVKGKDDWIFVKVHTHGAVEKNAEILLGEPADKLFHYLEAHYNDGKNCVLHYVTARETCNIIKAAEAGETGNPAEYRNYKIASNLND